MVRCLVTGGAGFIGSHLVESLVRNGHRVTVLDDLSGGSRQRVPAGVDLAVGSVTDVDFVDSLFAENRFERVFHFAAFAAEAISHSVKQLNYGTNVMGSINLINASLRTGVRFFCFASSVAVYGHGETPMRESVVPVPADSYGLAKYLVERELEVTMRTQGLPFTAFRMHNVYGEWQNMRDPYRNAVAIFFNQILRGEPITVYGDGGQVRAFTYVGDVVNVVSRAAETEAAWGRAFNVGSSSTNTVLELAQAVRSAAGVPEHPIAHLPSRDEVRTAYTATELARSVFGDWTDTPLAEGLARTARWAADAGPAELQSSFDIEIGGDRIPEWARLVNERLSTASR
ncbi:NDP-glucose 4-epimerase [Micromonospora sp. ATCC 39149]|uniref:NAD-dependent epimerase/dehydratase family protein n=1 Tax=Micromonospora carbonacea TaxID=47853 RepID=A0A7D6C6L5_9ACTN|nr:NAD-dependent epimerase/dehydratase family protein [Micromonospora sp. ATCC 39149]EEP73305.1 NDP-glucose 4-epimerase [Micromonospora sp. ATCC 39149]QLJ99324.1 NAD-dependent epimerase/dehydratase family protein [Micromonospora carbonacea]